MKTFTLTDQQIGNALQLILLGIKADKTSAGDVVAGADLLLVLNQQLQAQGGEPKGGDKDANGAAPPGPKTPGSPVKAPLKNAGAGSAKGST